MRKGGDGAVFKAGQAVDTPVGRMPPAFQSSVGLKTGDTEGTPTANDPAGILNCRNSTKFSLIEFKAPCLENPGRAFLFFSF